MSKVAFSEIGYFPQCSSEKPHISMRFLSEESMKNRLKEVHVYEQNKKKGYF